MEEPREDDGRRSVIEERVPEKSLMGRFAEEELSRICLVEDTLVQVQSDGPGAVNPMEEQEMEVQEEEQVPQEEEMDTEIKYPQGEVVE